ncbi:hypothetical protein GCM10023184_47290 [Flaviaesturariibacter amylovorans]|uniref:4Fe-4S ferredoxin-type domain-containing protein n=1 Tax=Flaviaesturariibacter amylovorans TaxID=1084520 RepID=A0ABP8HVN2_9BACT
MLLLSLLAGCRPSGAGSDETILGLACGMCDGNCFSGIRMRSGNMERFAAPRIGALDRARLSTASPEEAQRFNRLIKLLPPRLDRYPNRIGCPDCADQCTIYLSVPTASGNKTIELDPNQHPPEFAPFVKAFMEHPPL